MANCYLSFLAQIMADALLIISLRQFWLRRMFFWKQALPKKGRHMLKAKIGINRSDRSGAVACPAEDRTV